MKKILFCLFLFTINIVKAEEPQLKIGIITDLSSVASYWGNQTRVGALLAQQEINENGGNLKLIFEDSALKTAQAVSAAQKLLFVDHVDAFYINFSAISAAVSPILKNSKKIMIYAAAAESILGDNPYAFKTYTDYQNGCQKMAEIFKKRGIKKIAILKVESEYGELCEKGLKNIYKEGYQKEEYKVKDDVRAQILRLYSKGTEAILNTSYEGDITNMLQAMKDINFKVPIASSEDPFTEKLIQKYKDQLSGSLSFGVKLFPEIIITKFKKIAGDKELSSYEGAGLAYLHINHLYTALKNCAKADLACQMKVVEESSSNKELNFDGWQDRVANIETTIKEFKEDSFKVLQ